MRRLLALVAVLPLCGCLEQRAHERAAPDVPFQGPLRPIALSGSQIDLIKKGVTDSLIAMKDASQPSFGTSFRGGKDLDGDTVVCGFVNGKRFAGVLTKPVGGAVEFLPVRIALTEDDQREVQRYCRDGGIYMPD